MFFFFTSNKKFVFCLDLYFFIYTLYNGCGDMMNSIDFGKCGNSMNPVALNVFGFEVRWYSLLILIGVLIAFFSIMREAKKFNISGDFIFNMFFWTIIIGILGARLYFVIFNWGWFGSHISEIWQIWRGGLAIHGGIIFGLITISIYCRKYNIRTLKIIDMIVVPLILAQAIGRWGNFFNNEACGPASTLNHLQSLHIPMFIINGMEGNGVYYTPTFFYESLWCILGFIILLVAKKFRFLKIGQLTSIYLIWYGIGRFLIEALRTDPLTFLGFKMAQIVSLIMILIGVVLFINGLRKEKFEDLYNEEGK